MLTKTTWLSRKCGELALACISLTLLCGSFAAGDTTTRAEKQSHMDAEEVVSFKIPERWNYHVLCGKSFFIALRYNPALWKETGLSNEPFVAQSASVIDYSYFGTPDTSDYQELLSKNAPVILRGKTPPEGDAFARASADFKSRYVGCFNNMTQEWTRLWVRKNMPAYVEEAGFTEPPKNREEAFNMARILLEKRFAKYTPGQKQVIIQASVQDHYAFSLPDVAVEGVEMGGAGGQNPAQIASARGASRQYGKPWIAYIESLNPFDGFTNYMFPFPGCSTPRGEANYKDGPDCGLSRSLYKRLFYASYMGGCNLLFSEMDSRLFLSNYDFRTIADTDHLFQLLSDKKYFLSPVGYDLKEFYDTTVMKHDRGIPYTPVGLLLDRYHNLNTPYSWDWGLGKIEYADPDYMMRGVINTIWPWEEGRFSKEGPESYCMVTSAFGDIFDIITNDTDTADNIKNYKVILLVGNVNINQEFYGKIVDYVRNGGTLFINAEQVNSLFSKDFLGVEITNNMKQARVVRLPDNALLKEDVPFQYREIIPATAVPFAVSNEEPNLPIITKNVYGKGVVYLTAPYYLYVKNTRNRMLKVFSWVMKNVSRENTPCIVDGNVQYLINRNINGWVVTLINNEGITKEPFKPMVADSEKKASVKVSFKKELEISDAVEWTTGQAIDVKNNSFALTVPPGDVRIVEILTNKKAKP